MNHSRIPEPGSSESAFEKTGKPKNSDKPETNIADYIENQFAPERIVQTTTDSSVDHNPPIQGKNHGYFTG